MTLRVEDSRQERIVAEYLDREVYPGWFECFKRYDDRNHQIKGIDIEARKGGRVLRIDEKAAVHYLRKELRTFAMEVSFLGRTRERQPGWFVRDDLETDRYVFAWPRSNKACLDSVDDISSCEVVLVSKICLRSFFERVGVSHQALTNLVSEDPFVLIEQGLLVQAPWGEELRPHVTDRLDEKPFNILVSKKRLFELAEVSIR